MIGWKLARKYVKTGTVIMHGKHHVMTVTTNYHEADKLARRAIAGVRLSYTGVGIDGRPIRVYRVA